MRTWLSYYVFAIVYVFLLWEHFRCQQRKWRMRVLEACRCSTVCLIKMYTWKQYEPRLRGLCTASPPVSLIAGACRRHNSVELLPQLLSGLNVHRCWHHSVNTTALGVESQVRVGDVQDCSCCNSDWLKTDGVFLKDRQTYSHLGTTAVTQLLHQTGALLCALLKRRRKLAVKLATGIQPMFYSVKFSDYLLASACRFHTLLSNYFPS